MVVSNKVSIGKTSIKCFNGYKYTKIRPLYIFLPKMGAYRRVFDETKYMSFLIKYDELLEKYHEIWEKVKNSIKKEFDSKPIYNKKCLKAKIKSYNVEINTNFCNNKVRREVS